MGTNLLTQPLTMQGRTSEATETHRVSVCEDCFKENNVLGDDGFRGGHFAT